LALDDPDDVGRDARVELLAALERGHHLEGHELAHGGQQLEDGRSILHCAQSISCSSSCSTSAVRRPKLASSRPGTPPSRKVRAWAMQITAHFMLPKTSQKCTTSGFTGPPPAALYASNRSSRWPIPPTGAAPPKRHAFTHIHPRSSIGSP